MCISLRIRSQSCDVSMLISKWNNPSRLGKKQSILRNLSENRRHIFVNETGALSVSGRSEKIRQNQYWRFQNFCAALLSVARMLLPLSIQKSRQATNGALG
jgi:hypothetical protein